MLLYYTTFGNSHIDVSAYWRCARYGTAYSAGLYAGIQLATDVVLITLTYFSYSICTSEVVASFRTVDEPVCLRFYL